MRRHAAVVLLGRPRKLGLPDLEITSDAFHFGLPVPQIAVFHGAPMLAFESKSPGMMAADADDAAAWRRLHGIPARRLLAQCPQVITFAISLLLVLAAVASLHLRLPLGHGFVTAHRFWVAVAGYGLLAVGVLLPGL